jgi:ubiquinone/menaquinone biosynthesis C-methylase UbiE
MKKEEFVQKVSECGDAVITYRSQNSNRLKYNVCTLDFDNEYIQSKKNRAKANGHQVLLFCWDTDSFRLLVPDNVTSIVPLSAILKNDRTE